MPENSEQIVTEALTGKNSLEAASAEQLESISINYPYFGIAQFLYAKKLKQENAERYIPQVQKTNLHFPNALWLAYNLQPGNFDLIIPEAPQKEAEGLQSNFNERGNALVEADTEIAKKKEEETDVGIESEPAPEVSEKLAELIKKQIVDFKKPVNPDTEVLLQPEPSFKTDYFASQGIKLENEKAEDNLTVKLHKFTDWLKQMKTVNAQPSDLGTDQAMESMVQNIAENSNESQEVVTETMAEVLVKQGKLDKAIQLYNKLSFLNPPKSSYFAAKISELKSR